MRALFQRYLDAVLRRPGSALLVALLVTAVAGVVASRIGLRTDFRELLPRNYRSITDLERIEQRVGASGGLVLAVESPDKDANLRAVEALATELRKLPPSQVRWVDYHVREERAFFEKHKLLYADVADLERFRDELRAKIEEEKRKHDPFELGLDARPPAASGKPATFDIEAYRKKYREKLAEFDRYPGGYYVSGDGKLATLTLRVPGSATGVDSAKVIVDRVLKLVAELDAKRFHPEMKVGLTGDMRTGIEEYEATRDDLVYVTTVCMGLIILVVVLYFRSVRSLVVLGVPLLMGIAWTFAVATLAVGFLNASTMFLASIVAGNGVNFGIILFARYMEERRAGKDIASALSLACTHTAKATLIAALAAGIAYGSLLATDFRGFNQFGFIGGVGMVLCWLATFAVMPPLVALMERLRPLARAVSPQHLAGDERRGHSRVAWSLAGLATRAPRLIVVLGVLSFGTAAYIGVRFLREDPFLYNFRYLRNVESRDRGSGALNSRVAPVAHSRFSVPGGMIILAERLEQVPQIEAALAQRNTPGQPPVIGGTASVFSLLPKDQARKLPVLRQVRALITENQRYLKFLSAEQRREVDRITPPADLRALGPADLPEKMARPFTDVDGARGLVLYVQVAPQMSVWDGRDLIRFSAAVRQVRLPNGEEIHASGHPVIFADMIQAVLADGPRAALFSFAGVLVLVAFAFRRWSHKALVTFVLSLGVAWLLGAMGSWDLLVRDLTLQGRQLSEGFVNAIPKLNFLNFIVIPLTIGIGVDYGVNVAQRYVQEGRGSMRFVLASTGGAVALCSLTTIIGYSALLLSRNLALVSFGKLANLGELACLAAALTVLPAAIVWMERRRAAAAAPVRDEA